MVDGTEEDGLRRRKRETDEKDEILYYLTILSIGVTRISRAPSRRTAFIVS